MRLDFESYPVIDNHCHPFPTNRVPEVIENTWTISLNELPVDDIRNSAYFQMSTGEMCRHHGIESIDEMLALRKKQYEENPQVYIEKLWKDINLEMIIADIGSPVTNKRLTKVELDEFAYLNQSIKVGYINRIERVTDDLLEKHLPFSEFRQMLVQNLEAMVKDENLIALKSIIAYRTGLEIVPLSISEVQKGYYAYLADINDKSAEKKIRDFVFLTSAALCKEMQIPLQVHTGAGDSPLSNLIINNPLLLFQAINDPRCKDTRIMMVHAGNPNVEYAAYLVGHYPNLYLDVSSMLPYFAHAVETKLKTIFEFAPFNKVMYGSDAGGIPDHFWFAAKYFKRVLGKILSEFVEDKILSEEYALKAGEMILSENARKFYKL